MATKISISAKPLKPGATYLVRHNGMEMACVAKDQFAAVRPFIEKALRQIKTTGAANS